MTDEELIAMARLAQRDDRMTTGALYGDLADRIDALVKQLAEADAVIEAQAKDHASNNIRLAETAHRAERLEAAIKAISAEAYVTVETKKHGGIKYKWMYFKWREIAIQRIDIARNALVTIGRPQ